MKKKLIHILQTACFCLLALLALFGASELLKRKESDIKAGPFFAQKEDFDVLFFGNSHMVNGLYPMELWKDYGIVSYNLAGYGTTLPLTYWVMVNAFDHTTPKLAVIDIHNVGKTYRLSGSTGDDHNTLDAFPLTLNKIRAIEDLMSDPETMTDDGMPYTDLKMEFYFPLGKYHSRWNDLTQKDFAPVPTRQMGAETMIGVRHPREYTIIDQNWAAEEYGHGYDYLRRIIEMCQERGIEVLLTNMPFPADEEQQQHSNAVWYIAQEYGVDYLDFVGMDQVADYYTDLYDSTHLNPSGAKKVTDYIGRFITDYYDIPDRRTDEAYAFWHEAHEAYLEEKRETIRKETNLNELLMLLHDRDFQTSVAIWQGAKLYRDDDAMQLMQNMAREHIYESDEEIKWSDGLFPLALLEEAAMQGDAYFACIGPEEIAESAGEDALALAAQTFDDPESDAAIRLMIRDAETKEVVAEKAF